MASQIDEKRLASVDVETQSLATSVAPSSIYAQSTIAPSEITDIQPSDDSDLQVFTAAGRPIPQTEQSISLAPSINRRLPVKFNDTSFVSYPIPQSDIDEALSEEPMPGDNTALPTYGEANPAPEKPAQTKKSLFSAFKCKSKEKESKKSSFQMVKLMRSEYMTYFAKGEKGEYICTVARETGEWKQVLKMRLDDSELQSRGREDRRFANGGTWRDGIAFSGPSGL